MTQILDIAASIGNSGSHGVSVEVDVADIDDVVRRFVADLADKIAGRRGIGIRSSGEAFNFDPRRSLGASILAIAVVVAVVRSSVDSSQLRGGESGHNNRADQDSLDE